MRTGDFPGLGGRDLENGLRVHDARFSFFSARRGHEPQKFRIRPDAAGTERSSKFFFLSMVRWFAELAARFRNFPPPAEYNISCIYIIYIIYLYHFFLY